MVVPDRNELDAPSLTLRNPLAGQGSVLTLELLTARLTHDARDLEFVDPDRLASEVWARLHDGVTASAVDDLAMELAATRVLDAPEYSRFAARILARALHARVVAAGIHSFSSGIAKAASLGLVSAGTAAFVATHAAALDAAIDPARDERFEYFGLRTLSRRYLMRDARTNTLLETPQTFFLRVACGLADTLDDALEVYDGLSSFRFMTSSPTLFNSGTAHPQLSSCFLVDSPQDDLGSIYDRYKEIAMLSKWAGGIGVAFHRVRADGSLIQGTGGPSRGIVPFLKTLDASVAAVDQGGKRKGACCVYLETWHADILPFLGLRNNTGDPARRTHNLNLANWIPDLFMQRVQADASWSLFDPAQVPDLCDRWGDDFVAAYEAAEAAGLAAKTMPARELYLRMLTTLAETGNGWMCFKDTSNRTCNQTADAGRVVHLSNLCTEILEVTSDDQTAVCNLASINLGQHVQRDADGTVSVNWEALTRTVHTAVRQLDRVIDRNLYPVDKASTSNHAWRPVGLGVMGLQDLFFQLRLPFDSPEAIALSAKLGAHIYFHALSTSAALAGELGAHPAFAQTRTAAGDLQFDRWGVTPDPDYDWAALRQIIRTHGLRNSLLVAIAPTATIASICGCYECIEPQVSNVFKRETMAGEFLQINRYLVTDLRARGLFTPAVRDAIKAADGSVQQLSVLPEDLRRLYRTAWELPQRALIDHAAARGPYVDQSQSLNLFQSTPELPKLSAMYLYAWQKGVKTTYYLRSRPASGIQKTTTSQHTPATPAAAVRAAQDDHAAAALACSLENPEACEACQ